MGFTIGGIRDLRPRPRRRGRPPGHTVVAEYTGLHGWDVLPGAHLRPVTGHPGGPARRCSCAAPDCPSPGAHPLDGAPVVPAGATPCEAAAVWAAFPGAAVLLPVGRSFDVIEVGEAAARHALTRMERMGLPLGPVMVTPGGRAHFLVAPGACAGLPELLYRTGWDGARLDLRCLGPGSHITAPPSDLAGLGPVRWLRRPEPATAGRPPHVRLLLGALAYVCHRAAAL
ncbi:bifunctional DNA primase/polymerase [Streptomyces zingiberis]|uniref:Bifunctional DNA primase/polymerase n=1 Tax=Streptomyces zingiberis TaxID=2053010 RepID=A0ABX1BX87_9ACTN|nr:bifunctional DNA primase/polymerase [Streptomyces zingiberis]NJQ02309.1 bifunctional DNA primase/polymerase [Streptomyces zingiberis]